MGAAHIARQTAGACLAGLLAACAGPAVPNLPPPKPLACTAPAVDTSSGRLCGKTVAGAPRTTFAYLGIPYAETTAGENRFAPPVPYKPRPGLRRATAFSPICPQNESPPTGRAQSEDCLSLNIWTPARPGSAAPRRRLPVMVFIHGGAFYQGASSNPLYDGRRMAAMGNVVLVTINYRVGPFGFLAGIDGLKGNFGIMDQRLALEWVRDNIARFGGDPRRVTIFGESAGAMSVGIHLVSPGSKRLFRAAIMESNPYGVPYKSVEEAKFAAGVLKSRLGCDGGGLPCLRAQKVKDILRHSKSVTLSVYGMLSGFSGMLTWAPVIDGNMLPTQPNRARIRKPVIAGTNLDEGALFVAPEQLNWFGKKEVPAAEYRLELSVVFSEKVAERILTFDRYKPVAGDNTEPLSRVITDYLFTCPNRHVLGRARGRAHGYLFTHRPSYAVWPKMPICSLKSGRVCHTFELPFVFGNPTTVTIPQTPKTIDFTPAERRLSDRMIGYWTRFAWTLRPNGRGLPNWPGYRAANRTRIVFDTPIRTKRGDDANCAFWDTVGYQVPGLLKRLLRDGSSRSRP